MNRSTWRIALASLALCSARGGEVGAALGPVAMDSYTQTFSVTFRSEAAARRASLHIAPLYHDLPAAFSTRMDDSTLNDLMVPVVMAKYGQKGTFYLNSLKNWYQDSAATGITEPSNPSAEIPRRLLAGGNSIGGHTLSHEYLPSLSKNDAFREIMGVRVAIESQAATPVNSFVYPFVAYNEYNLRNGRDRSDLEEMLRRSGYFQLAEHRYNADWDSGLQDAVFITLDNQESAGGYSESAITQDRCASDRPLFLVTMHAWVRNWGAPDFPKLAAIYSRWSGRKDLWYCNQNQYAAYRYQALHSRLSTSVEGNVIKAVLTRPNPLDLGDWLPLTFKVDGASSDDVTSVESPGAQVQPASHEGSYLFDLSHDRERGPIEAFEESDNSGNSSRPGEAVGTAGGLRAILVRKDRALTLTLRNDRAQPVRNVRVIFRLPLRWQTGVTRRTVGTLEAGASLNLELPLVERTDPLHYCDGPEYDVAQLDFTGARRTRLYAVCETPGPEPAPSFARNGFWILGPLAGDEPNFDPLAFARPFLEGAAPQRQYEVHWSGSLAWRTLEPSKASILDPDIIPTTGKASIPKFYVGDRSLYFPHTNAQYILFGAIASPSDRIVRAVFRRDCTRRLSLNGRIVEGDELHLRAGTNDVRILYAPSQAANASFDYSNYGCYFRLVDMNGRRVEDVRFERPRLP